MTAKKAQPRRKTILANLARAGRENSDATVLFHARLASILGLHTTDYKTLSVLERRGPLSAGEIAAHSGLATASVTNLIDRLEQKGFARRVTAVGDRRKVLVEAQLDQIAAARQGFSSPGKSLAQLFDHYSNSDLW